jgi:hypothetical protein
MKRLQENRWYSIFNAAKIIVDLWPFLCELIDKLPSLRLCTNKSEKISELIGDNFNRQKLFFLLTFIIETLTPLEKIQKQLETNLPYAHKMYHIINTELTAEFSNSCFDAKSSILLTSFKSSEQNELKLITKRFKETLYKKWIQTATSNLDSNVFGENGIFRKSMIFDPFLKKSQNQNFNYYHNLFRNICDDKRLETEFNQYMTEDLPQNDEIQPLEFWYSKRQLYPNLYKVVVTILSMAFSSIDAERSFSKFRDVLTFKRSSLSVEHLKMYCILYFNGDIEGHFDNY